MEKPDNYPTEEQYKLGMVIDQPTYDLIRHIENERNQHVAELAEQIQSLRGVILEKEEAINSKDSEILRLSSDNIEKSKSINSLLQQIEYLRGKYETPV
jgi:hypothetical protein